MNFPSGTLAPTMRTTGIEHTRASLAAYMRTRVESFKANLIAAGLILEGDCTREITETLYAQPEADNKPRKRTGNLRASRFTVWDDSPEPQVQFAVDRHATMDVASGFETSVAEAKAMIQEHRMQGPLIIVGYGAYYALFVHEGTTDSKGVSRMQGYKWMQNALAKDRDRLMRVIRGNAA